MKGLANFPKYESYRDSGFEWLDSIPSDWELIKMKFLYKDSSIKNRALETLLSVTQSNGVIPRDSVENRMVMPSGNLESFKYIEQGDFAISLRSFEGGLEYCHHSGIISPAYTVLKQIREDLLASYYKYLFKSFSFISEMQTSIVGIREGKNISYDELRYSYLPIPLPTEQKRIAKFLDQKTAQIDGAIAIKEQQIKLLQERKQIIIQKAVTQGLDPTVPMKDSGVEWIGQIPKHWEIKRLKYVTKIVKRIIGYEGPNVLSITQKGIKIKDIESGEGQLAMDYSKYQIVNVGDFAMNHMDLLTGYVDISKYEGVVSPDYRVFINTYRKLDNNFLLSIFQLGYQQRIFYRYGQGVSFLGRWRFPAENFNNFIIPVPPKKEQIEIVQHVAHSWQRIEAGADLLAAQINKLKEYKTSLINSAVTGKIKVTPDMVEQ